MCLAIALFTLHRKNEMLYKANSIMWNNGEGLNFFKFSIFVRFMFISFLIFFTFAGNYKIKTTFRDAGENKSS